MPRHRHAFRPSVLELEDRVVLNAHLSARAVAVTINVGQLQVQLAQAYDAALVQIVQAELGALTPGGPGASPTLQTTIGTVLGQLSQQVTQVISTVPGASGVLPVLQNEITGAIPGSLAQVLGTLPNAIAETGVVGAVKENLDIQITLDTILSAKLDALFRVGIVGSVVNTGFRPSGPITNLGSLQFGLASAYDTALVQVLQAELAALTPGGAPASSTPLQTTVTQALGQLSQQVGQVLTAVPGASAGLIPLLQTQITGTFFGGLAEVLGTVPNAIADTGNIGGLKENLYIQLTIDAILSAKLAALDDLTVYGIVVSLASA